MPSIRCGHVPTPPECENGAAVGRRARPAPYIPHRGRRGGPHSEGEFCMIRTAGAAVLALVALAHPLHAQAERWQVTLEGDHYVWDVRLVALDGRHLLVRQSDSTVRVPVAKMTELRLIQKSQAEVG